MIHLVKKKNFRLKMKIKKRKKNQIISQHQDNPLQVIPYVITLIRHMLNVIYLLVQMFELQ